MPSTNPFGASFQFGAGTPEIYYDIVLNSADGRYGIRAQLPAGTLQEVVFAIENIIGTLANTDIIMEVYPILRNGYPDTSGGPLASASPTTLQAGACSIPFNLAITAGAYAFILKNINATPASNYPRIRYVNARYFQWPWGYGRPAGWLHLRSTNAGASWSQSTGHVPNFMVKVSNSYYGYCATDSSTFNLNTVGNKAGGKVVLPVQFAAHYAYIANASDDPGETNLGRFVVMRASDQQIVGATAETNWIGGYFNVVLAFNPPAFLEANTEYYILAEKTVGTGNWRIVRLNYYLNRIPYGITAITYDASTQTWTEYPEAFGNVALWGEPIMAAASPAKMLPQHIIIA